jgi:hypothetical protein
VLYKSQCSLSCNITHSLYFTCPRYKHFLQH